MAEAPYTLKDAWAEIGRSLLSALTGLVRRLKCFIGRHDRIYWDYERCETAGVMSGIFRPWTCNRTGCKAQGQMVPLRKYPMPPVKQPKKEISNVAI